VDFNRSGGKKQLSHTDCYETDAQVNTKAMLLVPGIASCFLCGFSAIRLL
jgi:hypothetical protein